jgi:tetratricopeptide (TPR) repeat protein
MDKAIMINDDYTKAYMKRGELYMGLEKFEEAIRDFTKAR